MFHRILFRPHPKNFSFREPSDLLFLKAFFTLWRQLSNDTSDYAKYKELTTAVTPNKYMYHTEKHRTANVTKPSEKKR